MNNSSKQSCAGYLLIWFLVMVILVSGGVVGYWYLYPQEAPVLIRSYLPKSAHQLPPVYKWQDPQGHWHVSDQPPPDRPYETLTYRRDTNVMPPGH